MKNFLKPNEEFPPIKCRVFENYGKLDALAEKRGYKAIECGNDDKIETHGLVGFQNSSLHCGWVATIDDYNVKALEQVELLKAKIKECLNRKEDIIVGFCQTGHFSIGYSIYRRQK